MVIPVKAAYSKKDSIHLFLGDNSPSKDSKIAQIKKENLSAGTREFNAEVIYAKDTTPPKLREILNILPAKNKKRLLIIKNPEEFSSPNKEIVLNYLKNPAASNVIIFDTQESDIRDDAFLESVAGIANVANFPGKKYHNSFDLGRAISNGNAKLALAILSELFSQGQKPAFILGGIASQWSRNYNKKRLAEGYEIILETDRAIKTGRLKPKLGLEILVMKLAAGFKKSFS